MQGGCDCCGGRLRAVVLMTIIQMGSARKISSSRFLLWPRRRCNIGIGKAVIVHARRRHGAMLFSEGCSWMDTELTLSKIPTLTLPCWWPNHEKLVEKRLFNISLMYILVLKFFSNFYFGPCNFFSLQICPYLKSYSASISCNKCNLVYGCFYFQLSHYMKS